jgi:hypothetical protein
MKPGGPTSGNTDYWMRSLTWILTGGLTSPLEHSMVFQNHISISSPYIKSSLFFPIWWMVSITYSPVQVKYLNVVFNFFFISHLILEYLSMNISNVLITQNATFLSIVVVTILIVVNVLCHLTFELGHFEVKDSAINNYAKIIRANQDLLKKTDSSDNLNCAIICWLEYCKNPHGITWSSSFLSLQSSVHNAFPFLKNCTVSYLLWVKW